MLRTSSLAALLLAAPVLAGCVDLSGEDLGANALADLACVHPHPCGDGSEWPTDLTGPFALLAPETVKVESFDGTLLDGSLWMPDVPQGVRVPVVIESTPYSRQIQAPHDQRAFLEGRATAGYILEDLLENGYAVALFSVRGTGNSGGCFELWGPNEQKDQAALVEWASAQPWSNGRVAMYGLSYMGTTPWEAAIQNPPGLKTIVVSGILTDLFLAGYTPQGAARTVDGPYAIALGSAIGVPPPVLGTPEDMQRWVENVDGNACPSTLEAVSAFTRSAYVDDRDDTWFKDRHLVGKFPEITAAVLVTSGYEDGSAHLWQDDAIWDALVKAPKRMVWGHWGHHFPTDHMRGSASGDDFRDIQLEWFDYWLKGIGDAPPRVGTVDYQTAPGAWRESTAWPPAERRDEILYLTADGLSPRPGTEGISFAAVPGALTPDEVFCASATAGFQDPGRPDARVFWTEPRDEPVAVAGNPMAYLNVESNLPGGLVSVDLFVWRADAGTCTEQVTGDEGSVWSNGAADLRFHAGNYDAQPFPTGAPTPVRVDLYNQGFVLEPGDRVAVVVSRGASVWVSGQPYAPWLTLHADGTPASSHIVLPVVEGTFGGDTPTVEYPPRPFVPVS